MTIKWLIIAVYCTKLTMINVIVVLMLYAELGVKIELVSALVQHLCNSPFSSM